VSEQLLALVEYRLARSWETIEEARDLSVGGHWNGVANRLHYACFYAVGAWLVCHGLTSDRMSRQELVGCSDGCDKAW